MTQIGIDMRTRYILASLEGRQPPFTNLMDRINLPLSPPSQRDSPSQLSEAGFEQDVGWRAAG
jgi:hypothetical protein